jgi:hypothetical protein
MSGFSTPVVIVAYNRLAKLQRLMETLAQVRPATLLFVADGPNAARPGDVEQVARTRRLLDRIPWRCEVLRLHAPTNVGCDAWVPIGLDWVFTQVTEAIVLEDDLIVEPGFFAWCAALLEGYRDDERIACICGRNELIRWDAAGADHVLIHRGSNWAFGTWRRAWQSAREIALPGPDDAIAAHRSSGRMDPVVADHCEWLRALYRSGVSLGWDTQWELQRALSGRLSAASTRNLAVHGGCDEEATHTWAEEGLRSIQPLLTPPPADGRRRSTVDHRLDRWSLFVELATSCRDPRMARRLARLPGLVRDSRTRHHLAPFSPDSDFREALEHLRAAGCRSQRVDEMLESFGPQAAPTVGPA